MSVFKSFKLSSLNRSEYYFFSIIFVLLLFTVLSLQMGFNIQPLVNQHDFSDQRIYFNVKNASDVLSNLAFLFFGILGFLKLNQLNSLLKINKNNLNNNEESNQSNQNHLKNKNYLNNENIFLCQLFFIGLILTSVGSTYYHLKLDEFGLLCDRLGMSIAFAGLLGLAVADRISLRFGIIFAIFLLFVAPIASWIAYADLNLLPWVIVQFGGMILIIALAAFTQSPFKKLSLWSIIIFYALAKIVEVSDEFIFELTHHFVSGHTLKHFMAAFAAYPVLKWLDFYKINALENNLNHLKIN